MAEAKKLDLKRADELKQLIQSYLIKSFDGCAPLRRHQYVRDESMLDYVGIELGIKYVSLTDDDDDKIDRFWIKRYKLSKGNVSGGRSFNYNSERLAIDMHII